MARNTVPPNDVVRFLRKREYTLVRELGQGACGKTVLLHDPQIDEDMVCKKYSPFSETHSQELFAGFVREIKLLHKIHHQNVVRVFNYYLYPDELTGYILMEFINGTELDDYLKLQPEQTNEVFMQTIRGFSYLQEMGILHRDIRPGNVMVSQLGIVKIIDLGFGKEVKDSRDFEKSISLNWWCPPPNEFRDTRYDFCSEVYFVGRLFEKIVQDYEIGSFQYADVLDRMCQVEPAARIQSFADIEKEIGSNQFFEIGFGEQERDYYQTFADALSAQIPKIESGAQYAKDTELIQKQLEDVYRRLMLERMVPDSAVVLRCFLSGNYYYKKAGLPVGVVKNFLWLLKTSSEERKRIIMANLHTRLDSVLRYSAELLSDDDVPF
jgi:serine/threonine-protein kinase